MHSGARRDGRGQPAREGMEVGLSLIGHEHMAHFPTVAPVKDI